MSLTRLVGAIALLGVGLQLAVALLVGDHDAVATLELGGSAPAGWPLLVALLALTVIGDLVAVRVRHGEESEELTLFEAAVVVSVLLLPAVPALLVPVVASLICSLVRRRDLVKTIFNSANLAAATAALVLVVHTVSGPGQGLSWRTVVALVVGTLAFTAVNLVALSRVLGIVTGDDPWAVVRAGARLSAVMAVGTVALGGSVVTIAWAAPALLPFTVMPAAALTFAYRAAAQESEERERSSRLLALSQVLAGRLSSDELLESFLELSRQAFGADVAFAVLDPGSVSPGGSVPTTVSSDRESGLSRGAADELEQVLLLRAAQGGAAVLTADLPVGWARAVLTPLEAEGRRMGALVLVTRDRHRPLGPRELTLLTPLGSALAVALRGAAHLQRITEETSKLKAVVDSSSDGILVLDGAGRVQLWSPALAALTGRDELAALGRPLGHLIATLGADGNPCDPFTAGRSLLSPEKAQAMVEMTLLRDDGEQKVVRCAHAGVFEGEDLVRDVVIVHDVTRERQVERLKADFIATVSHELRTPVTPIKGYADLLRRRGDQMTPEKRAECLEVIGDRASHLARLVEDLLLASRISATEGSAPAQVDMGQGDLVALTKRACGDFGVDGARVSVHLPDHAVDVGCDTVRVIQVLTNMVGNALKYSTPGSPVDVRVVVTEGEARVEVEDRGRGIPADQLERVFEKFHRVEDPMRMTTGGTGLGLYIARQLASAMGGTLTCTSTLGVGSVFTFSLPMAASRPRPVPRLVPVPSEQPDVPLQQAAGSGPLTEPLPGPRAGHLRAAPTPQGPPAG
jgi:PAS domain S-box-containing protein